MDPSQVEPSCATAGGVAGLRPLGASSIMPPQLGQPQMSTRGQAPLRAVVEPTALGHLLTTTVCVFTTRTSPHLSPFVEKEMATHSSVLA